MMCALQSQRLQGATWGNRGASPCSQGALPKPGTCQPELLAGVLLTGCHTAYGQFAIWTFGILPTVSNPLTFSRELKVG